VSSMDSRDLLRQTPTWLEVMTAGLSDARWRQRPAEGQWSALEVVRHLLDIETDLYGLRVRRLARGEQTDFTGGPGFNADRLAAERRYNEADPKAALADFRREREATLAALAGEVDLSRRWRSGTSEGDLAVLLARFANHDAIHIGQLGKVRRVVGIR
jgi:uncharacterized damage-inducible protein DinB